ncbi:hypothetical protein N7510_004261 [Penicillium lagena]|uniref:uncharacterized protein n=1 Tax=Penicillium lagena TaxID=94218 RepID=UPI002540F863|nr:uncharacterized protein N7510_004261 [Penicillium lagena]KAJ5620277.1 hypothetical protein N7510_004261 [Penicillium lagena]
MASVSMRKSYWKSLQTILQEVTTRDNVTFIHPSKLTAIGFVRNPPIDSQTPIQGRVRHPRSNATKEFQSREAARLRKALHAMSHGKHIFVYHHVRTKQVVYSLTRELEENNVLRQMIYHGKQTVPAELRTDMWVPYYSVHFADPRLGLRAFKMLREFSKQRQLKPPAEMITVTSEFLAKIRPRDPNLAKQFDRINKHRLGHFMSKKERARVLMDQKATSIADVSAVLAIQEEEIKNGLLDRIGKNTKYDKLMETMKQMPFSIWNWKFTKKAWVRDILQVHEAEKRVAAKRAARITRFETWLSAQTGKTIRISDEDGNYPQRPGEFKILWRDVYDANHAASWPNSVDHGELQSGWWFARSTIPVERQIIHPELKGAKKALKAGAEAH